MADKSWPPPGFPLVQGEHALTAKWSIHLPEPFCRRIEEGSLVLWRPGMTVWMAAWGNNHNESQAERLSARKRRASPARFAEQESVGNGVTRYSYRLREADEDDGRVESLNAFVLSDEGELHIAVYFDDPSDEAAARKLVDGVSVRQPERPPAEPWTADGQ